MGVSIYFQDRQIADKMKKEPSRLRKDDSSQKLDDEEKAKRQSAQAKSFFNENDPSMKLSSTGIRFDDISNLAPHQHSRSTYQKLIQHQLHQAQTIIIDRSKSNIGLRSGQPSAMDGITLLSKTQDQFMPRNKFVGAQQSGTFISMQEAHKAGQSMPMATPNYGIGYRGVEDEHRKPYA